MLSSDENVEILGDTDGDGTVSIMDATMIQQALAMLIELSDVQSFRANVDADSLLSILDATYIQLYLAQLENDLPIGEPIA